MLKCLSCGKEFLYAAKKTVTNQVFLAKPQNGTGIVDFIPTPTTLERYLCPYCLSPDLCEVEKTEPAIESVISVKICDADAKLKEGYEVKDTYASSVTLVKRTEEKTTALEQSLREYIKDKRIKSLERKDAIVTLVLEDKPTEEIKKAKETEP